MAEIIEVQATEVVEPLTTTERMRRKECEVEIERGLETFYRVGKALRIMREERLYREDYSRFEDYCQDWWGMGRAHAARLINSVEVIDTVCLPMGDKLPNSERAIRSLTGLEPDLQKQVWQKVLEGLEPEQRITGAVVGEAIAEVILSPMGDTFPLTPSPSPAGEGDWKDRVEAASAEVEASFRADFQYAVGERVEIGEYYPDPSSRGRVGTIEQIFPDRGEALVRLDSSPRMPVDVEVQYLRKIQESPEKCGRLDNPNSHDEHYTPPEIVKRVVSCLGEIDLDPCSNSKLVPNIPAREHFTKEDDGLQFVWRGKVFMNPPYNSGQLLAWANHLVTNFECGETTEAIALVPAYTDTKWWGLMMPYLPLICSIRGRLTFPPSTDAARFPSVLLYFGENEDGFCHHFESLGFISQLIS
ncbi:DNA N-6-adenine-methyltransferase [Leptolyngbyaceae cyanobacterium UHCC 1019]